MSTERAFKPLVKLTGLYENTSQKTGERYFTGFLGSAKVVILLDKKAEPGKTTWNLCIQEKEPKPDTAPTPYAQPPARYAAPPAPQAAQPGYSDWNRQTYQQQQGRPHGAAHAQDDLF